MKVLLLLVAAVAAMTTAAAEKKVVCYFGSWAVYRPGNGKFDVEDIDPTLCTHMIYTFVGISTEGEVKVLDSWQDLTDNYGKGGFKRFNDLRKKSPGTKSMVAIGGWNEGSSKYSTVVANPGTRRTFVENVVRFVKKHGFDGFDIDWEYPNQRGGVPADVQNYVSLVKELRQRFDQEGLILSAAVGAAQGSASQSYNIREISKYLHFINLMTYDLHGQWEPTVGINAPLYPSPRDSGAARQLNVDACVQYWLQQGAPAEKLVLGVPTYGRSFTLANPGQTAVGSPARQGGNAGPYTREAGSLGYNEICEFQKQGGWSVVFDEVQRVPYSFKGDQWVGYDNVKSVTEKAEYVKAKGLGGAMIWSVETDDFRGICQNERFPLLRALNAVLRNGRPLPTSGPAPTRPPVTNPTTPAAPNPGGGPCTHAGLEAHKSDCSKFYLCQDLGNGKFKAFEQQCPSGLMFDKIKQICNYADQVQC